MYICGNTAGPQKDIATNYDECSGSGSGSFTTILIQHGTATAYAAKGWLKNKNKIRLALYTIIGVSGNA